jgi:uncharacterized protein (DUF305 family)
MATSFFRHHRAWIYTLAGIVIGVGGTLLSLALLSPYGRMGSGWHMRGFAPVNAPGFAMPGRGGMMRGNPIVAEQHFLAMMIPHHEDAVAMADLALERATHPELKQLATAIKTAQTKEINQMRDWYQQWYGTKAEDFGQPMMMRSRHMRMDLTALKNAKEFDREFILQMIPHHQMAIMMSSRLMNVNDRPEIKTLTQNIVKSQSEEIDRMQAWYQSWYGDR